MTPSRTLPVTLLPLFDNRTAVPRVPRISTAGEFNNSAGVDSLRCYRFCRILDLVPSCTFLLTRLISSYCDDAITADASPDPASLRRYRAGPVVTVTWLSPRHHNIIPRTGTPRTVPFNPQTAYLNSTCVTV